MYRPTYWYQYYTMTSVVILFRSFEINKFTENEITWVKGTDEHFRVLFSSVW